MVMYVEMDTGGIYSGGGTLELSEHRSEGQGGPRIAGTISGTNLAGATGGSVSLTVEFEADMSCGGN